jgi:hypothetical protein
MQEPRSIRFIAARADLRDIQALRQIFLQENNFQIRYDACHSRGWTDSYLLRAEDLAVGYGAIKGQERDSRDTVFAWAEGTEMIRFEARRSRDCSNVENPSMAN